VLTSSVCAWKHAGWVQTVVLMSQNDPVRNIKKLTPQPAILYTTRRNSYFCKEVQILLQIFDNEYLFFRPIFDKEDRFFDMED